MDNNQISKLLTRRNIFIALGAIIALEVIWAGWFLIQSNQNVPRPVVSTQAAIQPTSITLSSDKSEYRVGDEVIVSVTLSSSRKVDGADLIISFDPKVLTAREATLGTIFSDYPQNKVDVSLGKVSVSGITSQQGGIVPSGEFGRIAFLVKATGTTKISLDFSLGVTVDTNVIESGTGKDILETVNQLELNILP